MISFEIKDHTWPATHKYVVVVTDDKGCEVGRYKSEGVFTSRIVTLLPGYVVRIEEST